MTGMDEWHGWLAWMTGLDEWHGWLAWMTGMDDWHGWITWMTGMDDWHWWLDLSYFCILFTDWLTDGQTDGRTLVPLKSLSQLKIKVEFREAVNKKKVVILLKLLSVYLPTPIVVKKEIFLFFLILWNVLTTFRKWIFFDVVDFLDIVSTPGQVLLRSRLGLFRLVTRLS